MRKLLAVVVVVAALFAVAVTGALATGGGQPNLTLSRRQLSGAWKHGHRARLGVQ